MKEHLSNSKQKAQTLLLLRPDPISGPRRRVEVAIQLVEALRFARRAWLSFQKDQAILTDRTD